jgi:FAR-17a/AIG1-like protein
MDLNGLQHCMPHLVCASGTRATPPAAPRANASCQHVADFLQLQLSHPRSFSRRSSRISLGIASFYLCWILVCSHFNGVFPYPFLNKMPWPQVCSRLHARAVPDIISFDTQMQRVTNLHAHTASNHCSRRAAPTACLASCSDARIGCSHAPGDWVSAAPFDLYSEHGCRASWR